jgi:hypothetical protein
MRTAHLATCAALLAACGPPATATGPTAPPPVAQPIEPVEPAPPEREPPAPSSDERLPRLYACWFERPYEYMFGTDDTFTAGVKGIVYYGNLAHCMGKISDGGDHRVVGDHRPIELYSRLAALVDDRGKFRSFNPDIIRWGHENLIPSPDMMIDGLSARDRYHGQFTRFFRLMTESYLTLMSTMAYQAEQSAYRQAVEQGTDGLDYLEKRFAAELPDHEISADGTAMTVPMAFGFWLRRGLDNTDGELWIGLRKVLELYDPEWYAAVEKKYPKAGVTY